MNCIIYLVFHKSLFFQPSYFPGLVVVHSAFTLLTILFLILKMKVKRFDIPTSTTSVVGYHSEAEIPANGESKVACSCLSALSSDNNTSSSTSSLLASAGWDSTFYLWDVRTITGKKAASIKLPGKAFSMDATTTGNRVVVSTAGRRTCIIDVRMMGEDVNAEIVLERESSLKYQTRVTRFFPDGSGLAVGSIEGRVAIEFLDELGVSSGGELNV